jgi:hypothetical protein
MNFFHIAPFLETGAKIFFTDSTRITPRTPQDIFNSFFTPHFAKLHIFSQCISEYSSL